MAQIKKEFEEANVAHAHELVEVREELKKAKEKHEGEIKALSMVQLIVVSH